MTARRGGRGPEKTAAEREQEELVALIKDVEREWRGPGRHPHFVAHLDPRTEVVTFVMRGLPEQLAYVRAALAAAPPATPDPEPLTFVERRAAADPSTDHASHSLQWAGPTCPECPPDGAAGAVVPLRGKDTPTDVH